MATRLYECQAGAEFEHEQRVSDPPLASCPICSKCVPKRLIAGATTMLFMHRQGDSSGWSDQGYAKPLNQRRADKLLENK